MALRITCINKAGGHHQSARAPISGMCWIDEAIGNTGRCDRETMWEFVTDGGDAYVRDDASGKIAHVDARINRFGTRYVQTVPDGTPVDNLLTLPECEQPADAHLTSSARAAKRRAHR